MRARAGRRAVWRWTTAATSSELHLLDVIGASLRTSSRRSNRTRCQELLDREIGSEAKDTIMTAAERYIEQGRQQGRQELLLRQLRRRFGEAVDTGIEARIGKATRAEIETWSDRVLSAATLDEVFAG
jgi:hypothetical protein